MKSIKQSRIDRLERRRKRIERVVGKQKNLTQNQKIIQENKFLKKIEKACITLGNNRCPHGLPFSGYECFSCKPVEIATRLREDWAPAPSYNLEVIPTSEEEVYVPVVVKTNHLTETLRDMQKNGFWYILHNEPMYLMPESIRCIIVKGMVQSPGYTDPPVKSSPEVSKLFESSR